MDEFAVFFASLLNSVAGFLWAPGVRFVVAGIMLLLVITAIRRMANI